MCYCTACGYQNSNGTQYCVRCAAALFSNCPNCDHQIPGGNKFCGQCGARLPECQSSHQGQLQQGLRAIMPTSLADKIKAAAVGILGERREVTVLFLDIANFTATAHTLDSEEVYLLTDEAMRLLASVVYKYEGTIDKYTGDGLMALFGAPVAHENDPERAVRAALEMQTVLQPLQKRIQKQHDLNLHARVGINTGLVIAGQVGGDLHMEYTVIGDTVNLADRLQAAADPGSVLVSFSTYQRTRPFFKYKTLVPLQIKGKPDPVRAYEPLGLRKKPGQVRGLPGMQVPMIGRQDALARLQNTLAKVRQTQRSQVALVTGEAGVGKSRLVAEFHRSVAQPEVRLYQGGCMTYARSKPFWLMANMLRDILRLSENDAADLQREALQTYAKQLQLKLNEVIPYLTNVLGLEQSDPRIEARLKHLDNAVLQKLIHTSLRQVFLAESAIAPTVLVLEDLHWVDPASRDFLEHLIQTIDDAPLMLILISRDAERESVIQSLIAAGEKHYDGLVDIQLRPLSKPEVKQLVDQLFRETTDNAQHLKRLIVERAEGNPFYAEEIVRMLIEEGGLERKNGAWQVTPEAAQLVEQVPGTLKGLILARFDRLSQSLRRTLQKAAVLGSSFSLELLQRLNGANPETIATQIRTLQAHQFLVTSHSGLNESYTFRHALIQEVVYRTLLKRDRQMLHGEVAQAIERGAFWLSYERTEALAYHYMESDTPSAGIPYLISAAENAARSCAHETAIQHYRRTLTLLTKSDASTDDRVVRIKVGLGQALKFLGEYSEAVQHLEASLQDLLSLSLNVDSTSLLPTFINALRELADIRIREGVPEEAIAHLHAGLDALREEEDKSRAPLWRSLIDRLAWVRFRQGKLEEAFRLASSATLGLDLEQEDDPMTLASLYNTLGGVLWQQGNLSEAITYVERGLELYKNLGYLWGKAFTYTNLGVLHYTQGDWSQAARNLEHAETLQQQIGDLQNRAITLNNLGTLRQSMGKHQAARRDLETSLSIRQRLGDTWGIGHSQISLAQLAVVQGRFAEAAAHVEAALGLSDSLGAYEIQARWILALIQAEEDLQQGLTSAQEALRMARSAELTEEEADSRRVLGVLYARAGDYLEAEVLLRESVDLCLQLNAPYNKGLALLELGRLYGYLANSDGSGHNEWRVKALTVLSEASKQFETLGATYDLQLAQALSRQLEVVPVAEPMRRSDRSGTTRLQPSLRLPEGEWHTASVIWLSLAASADADAEDVFEAIAMVTPALSTIAQEYDGRVIRRQDGLTVVFGAPIAYEDDAERAVHTARHMGRYLNEQSWQMGMPLSFTIAVSLGDVVAGQIDTRIHTEFVVKGVPVELAQQVADSAPPGTIWVTEAVCAATERVFIYEQPSSQVSALLAALSVWELTGVRERPAPARGLPGLKAKFIGRETPLQEMKALAQNLSQGIGGLIWIEGEPGIGKSRLMREFVASITDSNTRTWRGGCSPQKSGHAFSLFSDLLTQALNLQPTDTPEHIRKTIDQTLRAWPRDAQMTRPYLEMLLGVWPTGPHGERLARLEPEQLRQQTFVAMRRLCKSLAVEQPLVILLDDLHWIDPMSAELMQFLLTVVASAPILFVCAQRRQGADLPNDRLVRVQSLIPTQTKGFRLDRLSLAESSLLLGELLPDTSLPDELRSTILERSEGNPYFVEEFVRMLIEQGYLRKNGDRWEFDPDAQFAEMPLPSSLETLIRSRIDALPPELKGLTQYAAVVGAPFEMGLLEAVSQDPSTEANLIRLESRLLLCRGTEANQWAFNHSLIEGVVYNTMLKARRKALHRQVADALEVRWAGTEADHAEVLAYHFARADEGAKALAYLMTAGERAAARFANEEAITFFEQAALQLKALPQTTDHLRWRLAAGLGDVYRSMGKYADSAAALEAGLSLAANSELADDHQAGLYRRLGETVWRQGDLETAENHLSKALTTLGEPTDDHRRAEVARTHTGLAWTYFLRGRFEQARQACEKSLVYARHAGALNELAAAENLLGGVYYRQSEWAQAMHHTRRAMVLREQMGYTWGVAATLSNLGILAVSAGDWNKARSFFERSLALRQEVGDVEGVAIVHNNLGTLTRDQGDLERAEFHFRESLAIAKPFQIGFHIANTTIGLAKVLLLKGEIVAAQKAIDDSLAQSEAIGADDARAEVYCIQAEILLAKSEWAKARTIAEESAIIAAERGNRGLESSAWRIVSETELQRGQIHAAWEALSKAQRATADAADDLEAGRLASQRGRIHLYEGNFAHAEAELRAAKMTFMRLGANLDLQRVEEALRRPSVLQAAAHS